jgi:hypothetical protein
MVQRRGYERKEMVHENRYMLLFTLPSEENDIICIEESGDGQEKGCGDDLHGS